MKQDKTDALRSYRLIAVAALGYFVDIYDLILFGVVRLPSLRDLGLSEAEIPRASILLLNVQMFGMLLGGLFFGILGDRRGRVQVLFGSILLYSLANIANGLVSNVEQYAWIRFFAGLGLAGELGAGITLVSETLSKEKRGYGTVIVVFFGTFGAVVAALVADAFDWRVSYFVGGAMGLMLLLLRMRSLESGMFKNMKPKVDSRGDFWMLFRNRARFMAYLRCILVGLPVWFAVGILVVFAPEFARVLEVRGEVNAGRVVMWAYIGLSVGDLMSGILSQLFRSRKRPIVWALWSGLALSAIYLSATGLSAGRFYALVFALGIPMGYWGLFVTVASEHFGTNIRSTVTTTVPNFVRGSTVPITLSFAFFSQTLGWGMLLGAVPVMIATFGIALWAAYGLEETFGKDLDYLETEG